jgi:hypothetical protein
LLQYLEDVSDRELEKFIVENIALSPFIYYEMMINERLKCYNAAKWFCGFSLTYEGQKQG